MKPLKTIVQQLETYAKARIVVVSFSNRQTEEIQKILGGVTSIAHLETIAALIRERVREPTTVAVDSRYHGGSKYADFKTRVEITAYEAVDQKRSLAASIVSAYPNASNFIFVDDKFELLPPPTERIDVLQVSPLVWNQASVLNIKMF